MTCFLAFTSNAQDLIGNTCPLMVLDGDSIHFCGDVVLNSDSTISMNGMGDFDGDGIADFISGTLDENGEFETGIMRLSTNQEDIKIIGTNVVIASRVKNNLGVEVPFGLNVNSNDGSVTIVAGNGSAYRMEIGNISDVADDITFELIEGCFKPRTCD